MLQPFELYPWTETSAKDIFSGYQSLYDAYKDIEEGGVGFIQKKLGIAADGESLLGHFIGNQHTWS